MSSEGSDVINPEWLNKSFLEKALSSSEANESISVTSFEVSRVTAPGDNYGSNLFRVKVSSSRRGQQETKLIIVKAELNSELIQVSKEGGVFETESLLLGKIVPKIQNMLKETSMKLEPLAPTCFYSQLGKPLSVIVMEDLKHTGFRMVERTSALDMNQCLLVLRALARYHAGSAVLYNKHPELFRSLHKSVYNEGMRDMLDKMFANGAAALASQLTEWPEFDAKYSAKLKKMAEVATDQVLKSRIPNPEDFNALLHGDLWRNNIMFRYSATTNQVQDVRFVDFQFSHIGDVTIDIHQFLRTSPSIELLDKEHILVEEYHKTLGETFSALRHEELHPSLEKLNKQLQNKGLFAALLGCCIYPMTLSDRSDMPDLDKVMNRDANAQFSGKFRAALNEMLPMFEKNGWLDVEKYT